MQPERNSAPLERPLTARSVIASLLLGMRPSRLSGARLVRWCGLFDIAEGTARVALSRMVERGELQATDGVYELVGRVAARQPAQEWALAPKLAAWDCNWDMAVVEGGARRAAERAALREAMPRLRFAEAREGVWIRPANLPRASAPEVQWEVAEEQCTWWTAQPDDDPKALAERLFAPRIWAERASRLTAQLAATNRDDLAGAFVVGAAALAHVRADPLLPPALCPAEWPGPRLRTSYRQYQQQFAAAARDWFRSF